MSLMDLLLNAPSAQDRYQQIAGLGDMASPYAGGNTPSELGSYTGGGKPIDWIEQALQATGHGLRWTDELAELMRRESGGDPHAYNDTPVASGEHAQGLFQTIPSTFAAHNVLHGQITDPVANAAAAIDYIWGRYGNPNGLPSSGGY
jgi:hypothetical protein